MLAFLTGSLLTLAAMRQVSTDNTLTPEEKAAGWIAVRRSTWTGGRRAVASRARCRGTGSDQSSRVRRIHDDSRAVWAISSWPSTSRSARDATAASSSARTPSNPARQGRRVQRDRDRHRRHDRRITTTRGNLRPGQASGNAMKPVGEWNHLVITCDRSVITVTLNGENVNRMDLDQWRRPPTVAPTARSTSSISPTRTTRARATSDQDHGSACWFRNIKLRPIRP